MFSLFCRLKRRRGVQTSEKREWQRQRERADKQVKVKVGWLRRFFYVVYQEGRRSDIRGSRTEDTRKLRTGSHGAISTVK